jgi:Sulfotransferase domain
MWSGPRNISTAMMRSFSSRPDCFVSDEPFYGAFLKKAGADHPMRDEVIVSMDTDWHRIADTLSGEPPDGSGVWYQKQMAHHMVGPVAPDDIKNVTHAFLIRDPSRMIASYARKRKAVTADDLGIAKLRALFEREAERRGAAPAVVDAADVLADPPGTLSALCAALDIPWTESMLRWPAGRHPQDGVWASHWYSRVECSTGFESEKDVEIPSLEPHLQAVADACHDAYQFMARFRLGEFQ